MKKLYGCSILILILTFMSTEAFAQERVPDLYEVGGSTSSAAKAVDNATATALGLNPADVTTLEFNGAPGTSDPNAYGIFNTAASGFPTEGSEYLVMTTGGTSVVLDPNDSPSTSGDNVGPNFGGEGRDLTIMTLTLPIPSGATQFKFDLKFFSEEFPEFVGSSFNDGLFGEEGSFAITFSGSTPSSPNNIIFDQNGDPVTINTSGALAMSAAEAAGTTYDGATPVLNTTVDLVAAGLNPGDDLTIIFSIFDVADSIYDSAVFLDNFEFDTGTGGGTCPAPTLAGPDVLDDGAMTITNTVVGPDLAALNFTSLVNTSVQSITSPGGVTWTNTSGDVWESSAPADEATYVLLASDNTGSYFLEATVECGAQNPITTDFDPPYDFGPEAAFVLEGMYPNPTRSASTVSFSLDEAGPATLAVYDVMGRKVATLVDQPMPAGAHEVRWDGRSASGRAVASGVYLLRLQAGDRVATRRLTVVK